MPSVTLTKALESEYQHLFDTIEYRAPMATIDALSQKLFAHLGQYYSVGVARYVPGEFVGLIHLMESGGRFDCHLHNGDPLTARTIHVPAGRPKEGDPPFTWEDSAVDALSGWDFGSGRPRSVPRLLWWLERFNGWGYRLYHPEVRCPYLWGGSNHYTSGKYGADGVFSPGLRSKQIGAAVIFRRFLERCFQWAPDWAKAPPSVDVAGLPSVSLCYRSRGPAVEELQRMMNAMPGIYVMVDGVAGQKTSDAFKVLTGRHLEGDPRDA